MVRTCTETKDRNGNPVAFFYTGNTTKAAFVLLNPESSAGALGLIESTLLTADLPSNATIPFGHNTKTYFRLNGNKADFVSTFYRLGKNFTVYNTIDAVFRIKFTGAGVKNFTTKITSMSGHKKDINFSVTVVAPPK